MRSTGVIVLAALAITVGLLASADVLLSGDMTQRKPDRPTGPLDVAAHELSLPDPRGGERPPIAARVWAPQAAKTDRAYPLIVYVPGWGSVRGESDVLLSDVASAGFVVAAMDDVSRDPSNPAIGPADEAARTAPLPTFSAEDFAAFPEMSERRTRLACDKLARLLKALTRLSPQALPAVIDVSHIGVVGFSFGGAVAARALVRDPRVAAAVNFDGWVISTPAAAGVSRPFLALYRKSDLRPLWAWASARRFHETEFLRDDLRTLLSLSRSSATEVHLIDGVEHADFTDGLYAADRWRRWRPWRREEIQPDRMRSIMEAYLMPFLLRHVGGRRAAAANPPAFSEVTPIETIEGDLR